MNNLKTLLFALCLLACAGLASAYAGQRTSLHSAQDTSSGDAPSKPALDMPTFKKMTESGRPSEKKNILVLMGLTGQWSYTATFWAVPGEKPQQTKGTIQNDMTMEDRFMSSTFLGELNIGGNKVPFKGQGFIGYDNARKVYSSVWMDTLTTGMMIGTGKYDAKTNSIVETGQFTNPVTGMESRFRSELQFDLPEHYKRTIFAVDGSGRETKLMEFDYGKR